MAEAIDKNMPIRELLQKYPESASVFSLYGIGCIGCALAQFETLEQGLNAHGIDITAFMKDLEEAVNK